MKILITLVFSNIGFLAINSQAYPYNVYVTYACMIIASAALALEFTKRITS